MSDVPRMSELLPAVEAAAELAMSYFRNEAKLERTHKEDRSLVTAADRAVEALLRREIAARYPEANLIGEEEGARYDPDRPWTFAIDPIDGTDSFAAGAPSWCICVGLLDRELRPLAGIVHAPHWGSLFLAESDPSLSATVNGTPLDVIEGFAPSSPVMLIDSKFHRSFGLRGFAGKIRCYGSSALHICLVAEQTGAQIAHIWSPAIWDIAAAQAVLERVGGIVRDDRGAAVDYRELTDGSRTRTPLLVGHPQAIEAVSASILSAPS